MGSACLASFCGSRHFLMTTSRAASRVAYLVRVRGRGRDRGRGWGRDRVRVRVRVRIRVGVGVRVRDRARGRVKGRGRVERGAPLARRAELLLVHQQGGRRGGGRGGGGRGGGGDFGREEGELVGGVLQAAHDVP